MSAFVDWIEKEVKGIPGALATSVKNDVSTAYQQAVGNIRNDAANAVNQTGAALTSGLAGRIAPAGSAPVTIPLSSGQLLAVAAGLALLIGFVIYEAVKK
jgi:hypothetical protein